MRGTCYVIVSIRVPLRRAGRHRKRGVAGLGRLCFNPRPAPKSGTTFALRKKRTPTVFQSASRSEERDDGRGRALGPYHVCFNPRPAPKSGTTPALVIVHVADGVSIRVPLRRAGR